MQYHNLDKLKSKIKTSINIHLKIRLQTRRSRLTNSGRNTANFCTWKISGTLSTAETVVAKTRSRARFVKSPSALSGASCRYNKNNLPIVENAFIPKRAITIE